MSRRRPKISIDQRANGSWRVRWREHGSQRQEGGFESLEEAEDAADVIRERLRGGLPGVRTPRTVGFLVANWWNRVIKPGVQSGDVAPTTEQGYKIDADRLLEQIGELDAATMSRADLRDHRNRWKALYGSARIANKMHTALSAAFEAALAENPPLVENNPCRGLSRLEETMQAFVGPTRLMVDYLDRAAPDEETLAMFLVASRGALRQSELFGLAWPNVIDKGVQVAQVGDARTREVRTQTKTKRSQRRVPLPESARTAMSAIRPARARGLCFPSPTDASRPKSRSSFLKTQWRLMRRKAAWLAAEDGQGPEVWEALLELKWKHLRHHAISRWAAAGATIMQVSRWSGDSIATIDKHYGYLFDDDEDAIMEAIDGPEAPRRQNVSVVTLRVVRAAVRAADVDDDTADRLIEAVLDELDTLGASA